jgi:hypothetical protein
MHPALSQFPSDTFYEGSLLNGVTAADRRCPPKIAENDPKTAENGPKNAKNGPKMAENGPKMAENDEKAPQMAENDPFSPVLPFPKPNMPHMFWHTASHEVRRFYYLFI